jgi:hypothetical protein
MNTNLLANHLISQNQRIYPHFPRPKGYHGSSTSEQVALCQTTSYQKTLRIISLHTPDPILALPNQPWEAEQTGQGRAGQDQPWEFHSAPGNITRRVKCTCNLQSINFETCLYWASHKTGTKKPASGFPGWQLLLWAPICFTLGKHTSTCLQEWIYPTIDYGLVEGK